MQLGSRRRLTVLGSTGSIGCSTLDVVEALGGDDAFEVVALTGAANVRKLAKQAARWRPQLVVTADPNGLEPLRAALADAGATEIEAAAGPDALCDAAGLPADFCMAAIVGAAGLAPALAALRPGGVLALANKECLVCAGPLFMAEVARAGATLIPVDSEHSAIFQVFERDATHAIERVILTASGGPFRNWTREQMAAATPAQAIAHPNWSMGVKISIDSATMFNKALEMVEARHLFGMRPDQIEVVVHPQSIIHSMVGYADGSVLAQMGEPDMKTPIAYAINWPRRGRAPVERLDFKTLSRLDFEPPNEDRFPALGLARRAMEMGGGAGATLNGAKETAQDAFVGGQIGFLDMAHVVASVLDDLDEGQDPTSLEAVLEADTRARRAALTRIAALAA